LPEVLEDAALLVNPENVFEIARGMKTILLDEAVRQRLIEKGIRQVTKFSWQLARNELWKPTIRRCGELAGHFEIRGANCPPESGGQHDRDSSRDRAGGGSRAALFKNAF
jgi:hypothetical protein